MSSRTAIAAMFATLQAAGLRPPPAFDSSAIPLWAVFLMIMRELIIGGVRVIAGAQGIVLAADKWGKTSTAIQLVAILIMVGVVVLRDCRLAQPWMLRSVYALTVLCAAALPRMCMLHHPLFSYSPPLISTDAAFESSPAW